VLQLATILGPRLNDPDSFKTLNLTPAQTTAAMSELMERRVLRDGGSGFEFTNELIRARFYLKIPAILRRRLHDVVADNLLARIAEGVGIPGLEVAWHCIRARRCEEATPFLMTGAREAIMHGAPDEAARALSSALGHLRGRTRDEAALLLAETYQEMGRWEEALLYLSHFDSRGDPDSQNEHVAEILEIESRRQLHAYEASELEQHAQSLITKIRSGAAATVCARAALVVSGVVSDLRNQEVSEEAWMAVHEMRLERFGRWDRSKVLLARARTSYQVRRQDSGLGEALEAASLLEETGVTDTTFVRTLTGFGAIACAQGRYSEGLAPLERAYAAACRLDNQSLVCQAAYNRAICLSRIGSPEEHLRWANLAKAASEHLAPGAYERSGAAAQVALAHLALHAHGPVKEALEWLDQESRTARYRWVLQGIEFFKADLNWLLGRKRAAFSAVSNAREIAREALGIGFVGMFARWGTLSLLREGNPEQAWEELRGPYSLLRRLDAKDRADVLCCIHTVDAQMRLPFENIDIQAREALACLPVQCSEELQRLGLRLPN
jgi:tetratricopeptide (TPR) repeat protein